MLFVFLLPLMMVNKDYHRTFHSVTGLSSLMMLNLQSYPTSVLNERMWHFTRVKTYTDPSYIF